MEILRQGGIAPRQLPRTRKREPAPAGGEAPCARQTSGKHDGISVAALTAYRTQIEPGMEADRLAYEAKATEGAGVLREIDALLDELGGGARR